MLLEGKSAIIAGVGPGLGREVALLFARHGADLVLGARRREQSDDVAEQVRALGRKAEVVTLDIRDPDACAAAAATALDSYGQVDVLVNNAFHRGDGGPVDEADLDRWRHVMDINLWGTLQMTRCVVPAMKQQGSGRVVMINSMATWRLRPGTGAYTLSKAALESATKMLALELGEHGIRVNGVHPGYIYGPSLKIGFQMMASERGVTTDEIYDEIAAETALKYLPPPEEIAGSVLFLASDLSAPVTGQSLGVNAGHWLH